MKIIAASGRRKLGAGENDRIRQNSRTSGSDAVCAKQPPSLVIPKPALSAKNLLAASGEAADSSRDNAALRNDNSLGIFKLHYYAASRTL
jgi:hypothetical protein